MHVTGIIAEYNPFHNGHAWQLHEIRKKQPDTLIAVAMSGSITQRGSMALLDKWERAALAVRNGCDLVLELPFLFACRSAQDFARGGLAMLEGLGIDTLAFGAETDDLPKLQQAAAAIDTPKIQARLHDYIQAGHSYAQALTKALTEKHIIAKKDLAQANNILAIEYLRALQESPEPVTPLLIPRRGGAYHDAQLQPLASATAIRRAVQNGMPDWHALEAAMPEATLAALKKAVPQNIPQEKFLLRPLYARLLTLGQQEAALQYGLGEGLENRLQKSAREAADLETFLQKAVTSRYPKSRLQRLMPHLLLRTPKALIAAADAAGPAYLRVLAFNQRGRALLHDAREKSPLPLITKMGTWLHTKDRRQLAGLSLAQQMLAFDTLATELRELTLPVPGKLQDFTHSPVFLP